MTRLPREGILDQLDATVRQLHNEGRETTADGLLLGWDLPQRPIGLLELRPLLLSPTTSYATRDRAVAWVASQARCHPEGWMSGLVWLLAPGLRRMHRRLVVAGADPAEAEAELVAGLVRVVHERCMDGRRAVAATLCWRAHDIARGSLGLDIPSRRRPLALDLLVTPPQAPATSLSANPEAVLSAAVVGGVLAPADAELVAITRMDNRTLAELARESGIRRETLQKRRARAEARLAAVLDPWLTSVRPGWGGLGRWWIEARRADAAARDAARAYRARPWARVSGDGEGIAA